MVPRGARRARRRAHRRGRRADCVRVRAGGPPSERMGEAWDWRLLGGAQPRRRRRPRSSLGDVVPASTRPAACARTTRRTRPTRVDSNERRCSSTCAPPARARRGRMARRSTSSGAASFGSTSAFGTHAGLADRRARRALGCRRRHSRVRREMRCIARRRRVGALLPRRRASRSADGACAILQFRLRTPLRRDAAVHGCGPGRFAPASYDVVLIDGRLRAGCAWSALPSLLRRSAYSARPTTWAPRWDKRRDETGDALGRGPTRER